MAADLTTFSDYSLSETQAPLYKSAYRKRVLRAIEAALVKAHLDAKSIEYPVLAYVLEVAIAEVKNSEEANRLFKHRNRGCNKYIPTISVTALVIAAATIPTAFIILIVLLALKPL